MIRRLFGLVLFLGFLAFVGYHIETIINFSVARNLEDKSRSAIRNGRWPEAIALYRDSLKEHPSNVEAKIRLGWLYEQAGRWQDAEGLYQAILNKHPEHLDAQMGLARVLQQTPANYNQAVNIYRDALKKHGPSVKLLNDIGNIYKKAADHPAETRPGVRKNLYEWALYYYYQAYKLDPEKFQSNFNLGVARQALDESKKAAQAYCRSLAIFPDSYEARFNMGLVLVDLGYLDEAYRQLDRSLQITRDRGDMRTAQKLAVQVQAVKIGVYNGGRERPFGSDPTPAFLNPKCLLELPEKK